MRSEHIGERALTITRMPVEEVPAGEGAAIDAMITTLKAQLTKRYHDRGKTVLRDAHPKHHGLVTASFSVDAQCPVELRQGLFSAPRTFKALIRFSNGHPVVNHDLAGDLRGMAIKLFTSQAEISFLDDAAHDFVLATGEAFFGKDAVDFAGFPTASETTLKTFMFFLRGLRVRGGWELLKARKTPRSPLDVEYFSQTPYRLGPHVVKYCVRPAGSRSTKFDPRYLTFGIRHAIGLRARFSREAAVRRITGFSALRDSLARDLARGPVTLEFLVQRWPDLSQLPVWAIEDATRRWTAPWVRVATIEVDEQHDIHERDAQAEQMTFTPWRALPEHQPLGSINRARLAIYREMSKFRNRLNQPGN